MIGPVSATFESYCGMDKFWQKVETMADLNEVHYEVCAISLIWKCSTREAFL